MSVIGSFERKNHFSELNSPSVQGEGILTPQVRKNRALANLGVVLNSAGTGLGANKLPSPAPATAADTATLTTAQLANGFLIGTPTAAASYTLPTVSAMETALAALTPTVVLNTDEGWEFDVLNTSAGAFTITILTAGGWTLVGPMTIAQNIAGSFRVRKTGAGAYTLYRIST